MANNWLVSDWYSDSACSNFGGQTGFILNQCVAVTNGYAIMTVTSDATGAGTFTQSFYSDSACSTTAASPASSPYSLSCAARNNGYFRQSVSTGMPSSWTSDGVLMSLYPPSNAQCTDQTLPVYYTFAANDGGVCLPTFDGLYVESNDCQSYVSSPSNTCFPSSLTSRTWPLDECNPSSFHSTQLNGEGYSALVGFPEATCQSNATNNDSGSVGAIVGGVVGGVAFVGIVAVLFWWFRMRKAPLSAQQRASEMTDASKV